MRHKQAPKPFLLAALAVAIGVVTISAPASGARGFPKQRANGAVKALIRPDLIRAEIVTYRTGNVGDYRVYRGVVGKVHGRLVTLIQRDGEVLQFRLSRSTEIRVDARRRALKRLRPGMHATVMRNGSAAAIWLYASRRSSDSSQVRVRLLLSTGFVRCEVITWADGTVLDSRAYTGLIESADSSSLTLQGSDGSTVQMQIDSSTRVLVNDRPSSATDLTAGMKVTTIGNGDGLVSQIWAQGKKLGSGKR